MSESLTEHYFDEFYREASDPWGFEVRWYEERKRAITVATLPRRRFESALEVGCSIGVLTQKLADRCNELLAVDIATSAVSSARERLKGTAGVVIEQMNTPQTWPSGRFDLVVLSEVGYYWSLEDLTLALDRIAQSLTPGGTLLCCHWRPDVPEYPLTGDEVHQVIRSRSEFNRVVLHEEDAFLLEMFSVHAEPAPSINPETWLG